MSTQHPYSVLSLSKQTQPYEAHPRALMFPLLVGSDGTYYQFVNSRPEKLYNNQFRLPPSILVDPSVLAVSSSLIVCQVCHVDPKDEQLHRVYQ
jgi:hypothetical protein